MCKYITDEMANCGDPDQTAPQEQSDQVLAQFTPKGPSQYLDSSRLSSFSTGYMSQPVLASNVCQNQT